MLIPRLRSRFLWLEFLSLFFILGVDALLPDEALKIPIMGFLSLGILFFVVRSAVRGTRQIFRRKSKNLRSPISNQWHLLQLATASVSFLFFLAWFYGWTGNATPEEIHPLFQGALLCAGVSFLLGSRTFALWWSLLEITPVRMVFLSYGLVASAGAFILLIPVSHQTGHSLKLVDAFFLSVSALTVTGLTPVDISQILSPFGTVVLLFLIQVGGLGIVAITAGLAVLTRSRISVSHSLMGRTLYEIPEIGGLSSFLGKVTLFTLTAETLGAIGLYLCLPSDLPRRGLHALFHAISAFCNAGFSTFSTNLEVPQLGLFKMIVCILILLGAIGFPIIFEAMARLKKERVHRRWSSNTVLTVTVSGTLLLVGTFGIFFVEILKGHGDLFSPLQTLGEAAFYAVSTRTAGFNISDVGQMAFGTQLMIVFLMVIGGSPVSTAGGVKTTTAGVILASAWSMLRGHRWVQFRHREISLQTLQRCVTVLVVYSALALVGVAVMEAFETSDPWKLTFETISALSTVGLSLGITAQLALPSKVILIFLMLCGRLGVLTMVYVGVGRLSDQRFRYPEGRFYVG